MTQVAAASRVLIVGGGLAGACTAEALARRMGATAGDVPAIRVLEQQAEVAMGASGNPYGIVFPNLTADPRGFYPRGFAYTLDWLGRAGRAELFVQSGGLQLPSTQQIRRIVAGAGKQLVVDGRVVSAEQASAFAQIDCPAGIVVDQAGYYRPAELVRRLLDQSTAVVELGATVTRLQRGDSASRPAWTAWLDDGRQFCADSVVVCAAYASAQLSQLAHLPCEAVRGQTGQLAPSPASRPLSCVVSYGSYLTPVVAGAGVHFIGSTYSHHDFDAAPRDADSQKILAVARRWLPAVDLSAPLLAPRVCFRTSTVDRLPYIGPLGRGLYVNFGHGSKGILSCPLAGEIIASYIHSDDLHPFADVLSAISPARV